MATDRILVHADIAPAFINALKAALASQSDPNTPPPTLVNQASKARVQKLVSSALASGAYLVHDTGVTKSLDGDGGNDGVRMPPAILAGVRMPPAILAGVREDMAVWQEENFASLASCLVVRSDEEAVRIANDSGYGLSAAVFTEDLRKGFALARRIQTG